MPSIIKEPSVWGMISIFSIAPEVISPTITSKISLNVISPSISPYSSTIKPTLVSTVWKLANCLFSEVFSGINIGSSNLLKRCSKSIDSSLKKSALRFTVRKPTMLSMESL